MTETDTHTPENDRNSPYEPHYTHRSNGRGTLLIDRRLVGIGRIKRASGTRDPGTLARINAEISRLHQLGRRSTLRALSEGGLHPLALLHDASDPPQVSRRARKLYLYAMRAMPSGNIKIGTTAAPATRLSCIQSAAYEEIELLFAVPCERVDEMVAHGHLSSARIRGEWYRPTLEVLAWVEARSS